MTIEFLHRCISDAGWRNAREFNIFDPKGHVTEKFEVRRLICKELTPK